jgi:hypothetical protein
MNMKSNLFILILFLTVLALALLQDTARDPGGEHGMLPQADWQTYTNLKFNFTIRYPPGWKVMEVPNQSYESSIPQVWFTSSHFPPPNTGARPDVLLMFLTQDPSPEWSPEYVDNYHSQAVDLGSRPAVRVSGFNKEGLIDEIAYIAPFGDQYLLALTDQNQDSSLYFDQVMATLR